MGQMTPVTVRVRVLLPFMSLLSTVLTLRTDGSVSSFSESPPTSSSVGHIQVEVPVSCRPIPKRGVETSSTRVPVRNRVGSNRGYYLVSLLCP